MSTIQLFGTKRQFIEWVTALSAPMLPPEPVIVLGYDPVSWSLKAMVMQGTDSPAWGKVALPLPMNATQASDIWDSIQGDNLCHFFLLEMDIGTIVAAARNGLWQSLDNRSLPFEKTAFTELSYDDAKKIVGDSKVWSALCGEVQMFGVSCRVLYHRAQGG